VYFLWSVLAVSTSASDCLERLVSKMAYYVSRLYKSTIIIIICQARRKTLLTHSLMMLHYVRRLRFCYWRAYYGFQKYSSVSSMFVQL